MRRLFCICLSVFALAAPAYAAEKHAASFDVAQPTQVGAQTLQPYTTYSIHWEDGSATASIIGKHTSITVPVRVTSRQATDSVATSSKDGKTILSSVQVKGYLLTVVDSGAIATTSVAAGSGAQP